MKRISLSFFVIGILLLSACGETPTAPPAKAPPAPPSNEAEPAPTKFVVSNLQAIPRLDAGENVYDITIDIENTGGSKGIYQLSCKIDGNKIELYKVDGKQVEPIEVELNPGEKKTINLTASELIILGLGSQYKKGEIDQKEHTISVDGLFVIVTLTKPFHKLQLLSMNDERAYDYITVRGQVKNISNESLDNVEAIVEFYTSDGTFVKSDEALIKYNPILPNQTSPFEVITTDNPAIAKYSVSFKFLFGGKIPTEDKR